MPQGRSRWFDRGEGTQSYTCVHTVGHVCPSSRTPSSAEPPSDGTLTSSTYNTPRIEWVPVEEERTVSGNRGYRPYPTPLVESCLLCKTKSKKGSLVPPKINLFGLSLFFPFLRVPPLGFAEPRVGTGVG